MPTPRRRDARLFHGDARLRYTNKLLAMGPIAYWPMAESGGSVALDASNNNRPGAYTGVTLGQTGIGDGLPAASFDGAASFNNVYSASLAGAFNSAEGSIAIWIRVSGAGVWTDALDRRPFYLGADSNNRVFFQKNAASNQFSATYTAGGTLKAVTVSSFSPVVWFHVAVTWSKSADQLKLYVNGAQSGATQTALGTWAGAIVNGSCYVGAAPGPGNFMSAYLAHAVVFNRALPASDALNLASVP